MNKRPNLGENDCGGPVSSTATIPLAQLTPIVADGTIDCSLTAGPEVECFCASVSVLLVFNYPVGAPGGGDPYFMGKKTTRNPSICTFDFIL